MHFSGIRTRNLSQRAGADIRLDRAANGICSQLLLMYIYAYIIYIYTSILLQIISVSYKLAKHIDPFCCHKLAKYIGTLFCYEF